MLQFPFLPNLCLLLNLVYRSPNSDGDNNSILSELIKSIRHSTLTIGDFNYSGIDWENSTSNSFGRSFLDATQDAFLVQCVDFPTHEDNVIDLVLATNDISVTVESAGNLGKSHHSILQIHVDCNLSNAATTERIPDYGKADFNKMRSRISLIDWSARLESLNTFQSWDLFKQILTEIMTGCIPMKNRRLSNRPLWMNRNIMRMIRKKRRLWNHYKTTKDYEHYTAYISVQKTVAKIIRSAKKKLERKLAKNFKNSPRQFYAHLNKNIKTRTQVGPLKDQDRLVTDTSEMCDKFNNFFTSVFTIEGDTDIPLLDPLCENTLTSFTMINEDIEKKIERLKPSSAPGPDKFGPRVLIGIKSEISIPLCLIFNKSLKSGEVPDDWKCANVTPVFKKGSRSCVENYRPISLTSIICKIMESLLLDSIVLHLSSNNLIRSSQHGFMQHRSCLTNLLHFIDTLTSLLDKGHNIDVFYLDFSKAFDRVPHQRLLSKMKCHGIGGDILRWIQSWLSDRKQRVVLNGSFSTWSSVLSGVPQGSVLGPLLFIIFINDIDTAVDTVHCFLFKFADDTKGMHIVDTEIDAMMLQQDIDNLYKWSVDWLMLFNLDKCHVLHFGKNNPNYLYNLNGENLSAVDQEKDLGVYVTSACTPSKQVWVAAQKANQVLGQLMRAFTYRDRITFVKLYKIYVRPHLECCVQAWSPWLQKDIDLLENVQRRAVNAVSGISGSYEEKLIILNLPSLKHRRERGDMIQTFKMIKRIDNINPDDFFCRTSTHHNYPTRQAARHDENTLMCEPSYGLSPSPCNLEIRRNFFTQRVISSWNALLPSIKNALTVNEFKRRFDLHHE